ncbi:MAG: rod shape-determining protein MreD, partial [Methylococcales bacterium]|nr:rod shape-determining protein MreD [Methylococcales bacterium]
MIYLSIPILLILAIFQATILSHTSILGVAPQLLPLIALCFALLRKPDEAFVWAFVAGLSIDLLSVAPLGSTSIALMAAVLALILIKLWLPTNHFLLPLVLTGLGMFMFLLINLSLLQ